MLTACAWCATPFPANDGIEQMPVGRRLAFDSAKGRLWAVCRRCERWNLAPIEQRWEAIEACERAFRDTRMRSSTDQIGLARLRDGTELVRIGAPIPVEFAAWRYGDQFGRRRIKAMALGGLGVAGAGALAAGAYTLGAAALVLLPIANMAAVLTSLGGTGGVFADVIAPPAVADPDGGHVIPIGAPKLIAAPDVDGGWGLEIPYRSRQDASGEARTKAVPKQEWWMRGQNNVAIGSIRVVGATAREVLARHVPKLNRAGADFAHIRRAVDLIAESGGAGALPRFLAKHRARFAAQQTSGDSGELHSLPAEVKLALEMSAHEEVERAFLAGELAALESQWRSAEQEAAISDDLLLPPELLARFEALRRAVNAPSDE